MINAQIIRVENPDPNRSLWGAEDCGEYFFLYWRKLPIEWAMRVEWTGSLRDLNATTRAIWDAQKLTPWAYSCAYDFRDLLEDYVFSSDEYLQKAFGIDSTFKELMPVDEYGVLQVNRQRVHVLARITAMDAMRSIVGGAIEVIKAGQFARAKTKDGGFIEFRRADTSPSNPDWDVLAFARHEKAAGEVVTGSVSDFIETPDGHLQHLTEANFPNFTARQVGVWGLEVGDDDGGAIIEWRFDTPVVKYQCHRSNLTESLKDKLNHLVQQAIPKLINDK